MGCCPVNIADRPPDVPLMVSIKWCSVIGGQENTVLPALAAGVDLRGKMTGERGQIGHDQMRMEKDLATQTLQDKRKISSPHQPGVIDIADT